MGEVRTEGGERIGAIRQVYADDVTGQPSWVSVRAGMMGLFDAFVPLRGGRIEGVDIVVPYAKELVESAPTIEVEGTLSAAQEAELAGHYDLGRDDTAVSERSRLHRPGAPSGYGADESADLGNERRDS